jgi:hypothetical protein
MLQIDLFIPLFDGEIRFVLPMALRDGCNLIGVLIFIGHIVEEQEVGHPAFLDAFHRLQPVREFPVSVRALRFVCFKVLVLQVLNVFPLVLKIKCGFDGFHRPQRYPCLVCGRSLLPRP